MRDYQRSKERSELNQTVPIINLMTEKEIGELVNITVDGLMIISNERIETQSIFQFSLVLPTPLAGQQELEVGVDCLWCSEVENFHRYWAGFQIIDASPQTAELVALLIENYSNLDPA